MRNGNYSARRMLSIAALVAAVTVLGGCKPLHNHPQKKKKIEVKRDFYYVDEREAKKHKPRKNKG